MSFPLFFFSFFIKKIEDRLIENKNNYLFTLIKKQTTGFSNRCRENFVFYTTNFYTNQFLSYKKFNKNINLSLKPAFSLKPTEQFKLN